MRKIQNLFKAEAASPSETAMLYNGAVGFRVPEYQRGYDWSKENIDRLFTDCLNGFFRLAEGSNANAFTFLGTLILVEEKTKEEDFTGVSVAIVDGQQRLTTLTLLSCALYENLKASINSLETMELEASVKNWIELEIKDRLYCLLECAVGFLRIGGNNTYHFPRITRKGDTRGRSPQTSEYFSPLGKFLDDFAKYADSVTNEFQCPSLDNSTDAKKLWENFERVRKRTRDLNNMAWYEGTECEQVPVESFARSGYRNLFERLKSAIKDDGSQNRAIADLQKCKAAHDLVRSLLFAAYFCRNIVLTRVTTDDESAAFDIFDALNTTGEPLTALETLKPQVMKFENSKVGFTSSESEQAFQRLKKYVDDEHKATIGKKQKETKELLVSFALYMTGKKLPENLQSQRDFLRQQYKKSLDKSPENARRFVRLLADMAEFRSCYWTKQEIKELGKFHSEEDLEEVRFLASFIKDTRTKLTLPILGRYWHEDLKGDVSGDFLEALRAVTAFLVLRRAASGSTAKIDSDFRAIMMPKSDSRKGYGLCAGVDYEHQRLSIGQLKEALQELLAGSEFKITHEEDKWIEQVITKPLYRQAPAAIVRFLLFVAAHRSVPSPKEQGCWKQEGVIGSSHENNFLDYRTWKSESYETVEHVAPSAEQRSGWDFNIYKDEILRHSLGNLILLPKKDNSAIGAKSWQQKKAYYLAVTEGTEDQRQKRIEEATELGLKFSDPILKLLGKGERLSLLDPLRDVEDWNRDIIQARARNTAAIAWKKLRPWLV